MVWEAALDEVAEGWPGGWASVAGPWNRQRRPKVTLRVQMELEESNSNLKDPKIQKRYLIDPPTHP